MTKSLRSIERNIFIGFSITLAVTITVCALFYYAISNFLEANRMVIHTVEVIENIEELSSDLRAVQVMRRNFVISGDESFLKTYEPGIQQIDLRVKALHLLVVDNPMQEQRLNELFALILERRELATVILALRRTGKTEESLRLIVSDNNRQTTDKIDNLITEMKTEEQNLLNNRTENLINTQQKALSIIIAWGTLFFISLLVAYYFIRSGVIKRYNVQQELGKREKLYRTLVRNIPKTAVVLIDKDFRYTLADGSQLEKQGFSKETFEGKTIYEIFSSDVCETWANYYKRAFAGENITLEERKDDTYFLVSIFPIKNHAGEIFSVMIMWQDITESKNSEAEQDRLLQILNSSEDFIKMLSLEKNKVIYINPAGRRMIGKSQDANLEDLLVETYHPQWAAELLTSEAFPTAIKDGSWIGETALIGADGREIPTSQIIISHRDEKGEVKYLSSVTRDISKSKQIESALRKSERRTRDLIDKSPGYICRQDLNGYLLSINQAAAHALGYEPEELIGKSILEFLQPQVKPYFKHYLEKIQAQGELSGLLHVLTKAGEPLIWKFNNVLYEDQENGTYVLGYAQDVTENMRLETELKEARDAALESVRLKSEFLANMSHEIRTPMNGIIGISELLLQTELNSEQRDFAETVQSSGNSLLTIINDILDFSKIESGKLHFETVDFDVQYTIDSVTELFAATAEQNKLELVSLIYADVPTDLRGDPGRLRQILTNLVGNAIKFTAKGEVVVRVKLESETETHATLHFSVADTGIGISEESRKNLFNAFVQADGSITRRFGGTGLGLAISKQLSSMMDGEMDVESTIGKGSTFWFTAVFEKQTARQTLEPRYDLSGLRILIVDDNETNRKFLKAQTSAWKMESTAVASPIDALLELQSAAEAKRPYDIAIIDLMMPEMDGFMLGETIKNDLSIKDTRLLLMPSCGTRGHSQRAKEIGIDAYLVKPVSQLDLYNCLADMFARVTKGEIAFLLEPQQSQELITKHSVEENHRRREKEFTILIAEDNFINQKVIRRQIENLGFAADIVSNGEEAVNAYSSKDYSLIFMDCQMPVLDGYSATEEIRRLEKSTSGRIPIVALTASAIQGDREKCIEAGMDEYISKPTNQQKLNEIINQFMSANAEFSDN